MINLPLSETLASLELAELWNNYSPKEGGGKKRKWRALDVYENNRDNSTWKLSAWILIAIRATRANISRFRGSSTRRWRRSHTGRGSCCKRNLRECRISGEEAAYRDASCTTSFPWRAWIFLERGGGRDRERERNRENTRWLKVWTTFEQRKEEAKGTFLRDDTFKFLLNRPLFNFIRFHLLRGMIFSFFPFLRRLTQEDGDWIEVLKAGWWKDFDIEFFSFFFLSSLYYRLAARFTEESFVSSLKRFEFDE